VIWDKVLTGGFLVALLAAGVRLATPLLLAALGEIFAERAGVLNVGLEGMMLVGALFAFIGSFYTHSPWLGLLCGMMAAGLVSLLHAYLSITVAADQVVSGLGINLLSLGLVTFVYRALFGVTSLPPTAQRFHETAIPGLSRLPVLGDILFRHHALVYLSLVLVPIAFVVLFRTTFGLRVVAVGEDPGTADAVGIGVCRMRYACVIVGGLLAGMAGSSLSLGQLNLFRETMVAGRGYIAIAVVMLGHWNPFGALAAALLFGVVDSLQLRLQAVGIGSLPPQALLALPYLVTVLVLASRAGRAVAPRALSVPYVKQR
jgi:general nucleoside transport system permease protein